MKVNAIKTGISFQAEPVKGRKQKFNRYSTIPATGYAAIGMGLTSGVLARSKKMLAHKITAFVALAAATAHVVLLKTMYGLSRKKSS